MSTTPIPGAGEPPAPAQRKSSAFMIAVIAAAVLGGGCVLLGILAAVIVPVVMKAKTKAMEAEARNHLHALHAAEEMFRLDDSDKNGVEDFTADLGLLERTNQLEAGALSAMERHGWRYKVLRADAARLLIVAHPPIDSRSAALQIDETGAITNGPPPDQRP